jgi:hypothetical protein
MVNRKWCGEDKQPSGEGEKTNWKENETPKAGKRSAAGKKRCRAAGTQEGAAVREPKRERE